MKILSFSLDPQILNKDSVVAARNVRYGEVLESLSIIVPSPEKKHVQLSSNTTVYGTGGRTKIAQFVRMAVLAWQRVHEEKCDVITAQDTYFLGLLGVLLSRYFHCGLEVQVLGIEKLNFFRKALSQFTLKRAGSIRVLSKGLWKRLVTEFGISEDRMVLVPIYVDVSSLGLSGIKSEEQKAELVHYTSHFDQQYGSRFNIVSVNRLVPIKNIPMQLCAIKEIAQKHPEVLLHIVGDGPEKESLEKEIKERGLSSHVILHGAKFGSELSAFFTQSDCFVLTSDFEGFGMVVVEAATAGTPIVMTNVGCAGEVVEDRVSALIVEPKDEEAFTQVLLHVIEDEELRTRLGQNAQRSIAELPTFDMVLDKYRASWEQALRNKH